MNLHNAWFAALAGAVALGALSGCTASVSAEPAPGPVASTGRLTLRWTINGTTDPNVCAQSQTTTMHVSLIYANGASAGDYQAPCEAFATTVDLMPGGYSGQATLLNSAGQARTTTINIVPFHIVEGTNLDVPVDFPASSFYQ